MKVGYSQNSNKITEKSHLVNITFCFCLCLSFYTTWQLVVLCHISKLTFTNIWLGFNVPLHMDHDVSSLHSFPVQSEVENQSFPRILWKLQQASPLSWFIDNSLHFNASSFKEKLLWPFVHKKIGWDFFFFTSVKIVIVLEKKAVSWTEMKVQYDNCCEWETQHRPSEKFSLKYF